ncbi:Argonaute, partial [Pseudoloma neurophilia]
CKICPGQKYSKRLNDFQTSEMIKMVSKPAESRFSDLEKRINSLEVTNNQILNNLNISIDKKFYTCLGKQLNSPDIKFLNSSVKPQRGSWNLRNVKLIKSVAIQKWSVFILADISPSSVNRDISNFTRICKEMGMKIANPIEVRKCSLNDLEKHITDKNTTNDPNKKTDYELVMIILQDKNAHNYQEVKRICDINCNVISQCIIKRNIEKLGRDASFCSNIAIKVNTKLGGINYCTDTGGSGGATSLGGSGGNTTSSAVSGANTSGQHISSANGSGQHIAHSNDAMVIFGIDVTHPGTGDMSNNSIAAVVSSIDDTFTRYHTSLRMQERRKEIIEDLRNIVKEHLAHYRITTSKVPKKVLVFRDGIGDSSLQTVYFREIEEIKNAFKELNENYNPDLTFVIVQKKHSIRFKGDGKGEYVKDQRRGPTCNPAPGTLIDSLGTKYNDFYMISHFALQGTPCPIKYHILIDGIKIKNFSQFIYDQCHIFSRATKAVSVVPAVYYAHLAAARAKCYVQDEKLLEVSDAFKNVLWYL